MLRVRVELVPHGVEAGTEIIEEAFVWNDGSGEGTGPDGGGTGNYGLSEKDPRGGGKYPERDLGDITGLVRVPNAHRVTMARTALERIERKRYQENGLSKTDEQEAPSVR